MVSELTDAFIEMLDAQDEAMGRAITITIAATSGIRALEWPISAGEELVNGAIATTGGFRHEFLASAVTPVVLQTIIASDGTTLQISNVNRINDTWQTDAFSPVANRKGGY